MAGHKFGDFELDTDARQLRLPDREIAMQPRVFDLLVYLFANRERVVPKEELLDRLWPGVIVTESSLQRAISFVRGALREGGMENAVRTYARRGYRFQLGREDEPVPETRGERGRLLSQAYAFAEKRQWSEAARTFAQADAEEDLTIADLEQWALAAQCAGLLMEAVDPLERAAAAYSSRKDLEAAARANILLARIQLEARETSIARGCLARAATLLRDLPLGEQHGHLEWMRARYQCYVGDISAAAEHARKTMQIGEQLDNSDLRSIGTLYCGVAAQAGGETRRGLQLQDEAAAAVLAGDVSPLIGGIVYCGLIAGCCNTGDWPRAGQWTDSFRRWCDRMRLNTFAGSCILHRAEVYAARGNIDSARKELEDGVELLQRAAPWATGDAYRLMGDLHLARGEFSACEEAYRNAHEHGWDPNPGYALLLFYRGQSEAALRALKRAGEASHWVAGERKGHYLAFIAIIAALSGELELAERTLKELDENPALWSVGATNAFVQRARGEVALAKGDPDTAIRQLRSALELLNDLGLQLESGLVRISLARALHSDGDMQGATMELNTAEGIFKRSGADFYLKLCKKALDVRD